MSGELYLHVGLPKTGSTSIQMTCAANRAELLQKGVFYPKFSLHLPEINFEIVDIRNHGVPLTSQCIQSSESLPFFQRINCPPELQARAVNIFREQIRSALSSEHKILMSAESISLLNDGELCKLRDFLQLFVHQINVIGVVRNPVFQLISSQNQLLKQTGENAIFDKHLIAQQSKMLANLMAVFNHVSVFSFERLINHPAGLVGGFFEKLGINHLSGMKIFHVNNSYTDQAARLVGYLNIAHEKRLMKEYANPLHAFSKEVASIAGRKFELSASELKAAEEHVTNEVNQLEILLGNNFFDVDPMQTFFELCGYQKSYVDYNLDYLVSLMVILLDYPRVFSEVVWEFFDTSIYVSAYQRDLANSVRDFQANVLFSMIDPPALGKILPIIFNQFPGISEQTYNSLCNKGGLL